MWPGARLKSGWGPQMGHPAMARKSATLPAAPAESVTVLPASWSHTWPVDSGVLAAPAAAADPAAAGGPATLNAPSPSTTTQIAAERGGGSVYAPSAAVSAVCYAFRACVGGGGAPRAAAHEWIPREPALTCSSNSGTGAL